MCAPGEVCRSEKRWHGAHCQGECSHFAFTFEGYALELPCAHAETAAKAPRLSPLEGVSACARTLPNRARACGSAAANETRDSPGERSEARSADRDESREQNEPARVRNPPDGPPGRGVFAATSARAQGSSRAEPSNVKKLNENTHPGRGHSWPSAPRQFPSNFALHATGRAVNESLIWPNLSGRATGGVWPA